MTDSPPPEDFEAALFRLEKALSDLEETADRIIEADEAGSEAEEAFAAMADDRARLAMELDDALARNRKLASANDEVAQRLENLRAELEACLPSPETE